MLNGSTPSVISRDLQLPVHFELEIVRRISKNLHNVLRGDVQVTVNELIQTKLPSSIISTSFQPSLSSSLASLTHLSTSWKSGKGSGVPTGTRLLIHFSSRLAGPAGCPGRGSMRTRGSDGIFVFDSWHSLACTRTSLSLYLECYKVFLDSLQLWG